MANSNAAGVNGAVMSFTTFHNLDLNKPIDKKIDLPSLPAEMIGEIGSCLTNPVDVANFRLVNRRFCNDLQPVFRKAIANGHTIYPRYECFRDFLLLLDHNPVLLRYVNKIVLVAEGLKEHEHGYLWGWEDLQDMEGINFTDKDLNIIDIVNTTHFHDISVNGPFVNGGGYRIMLAMLLARLPKLRTIEIRKLKAGEHCPHWVGPELLEDLSFYHKDLNINAIYYGDWQYDTVHKRITVYKDDFGDDIAEPEAGPQASFFDDVKAAIETSGTSAKIEFMV